METAPRSKSTPLLVAMGVCCAVVVFIAVWMFRGRSVNRDDTASNRDSADKPDSASIAELFRDVTPGSGLQFTHRNGEEAGNFSILETLGGGVALIDYDGDGLLDIFVTGGGYFDGPDKKTLKGYPCKLYRNLGNWKFEDVTARVGLDIQSFYSHGAAVADYDRDGWPDLLVTGYGQVALFHNEPDGKGGRRFVVVTEKLGLRDNSWATSAGWGDIDGDGYPDLYICHYLDWSFQNNPICKGVAKSVERDVCPPQRFKPLKHAFFRNENGKAFRDISDELGFQAVGCGLGVVLADLNDDQRPDIYVANDATNKLLFFNRGGKLQERGVESGSALDDSGHYNGSMGIDVGDYDGSGRASLWVTNFQGELHGLYKNMGNETFSYQSRTAGLASIGMSLVAFGTGFFDFDNDGWEDLILVNGHVLHHPILGSQFNQKPVLLRNVEKGRGRQLKDISAEGGPFFDIATRGRGLAIGDLDNDGWPDVVVSHTNVPVVLLRNERALGASNRWLGVNLVGRGHRDIVGSTVIVEVGTRKLTRFAKGGGSYLSSGDRRLLIGLGETGQVERVTVKWSWGATETWEGLEPNSYWELREGDPKARRVMAPGP